MLLLIKEVIGGTVRIERNSQYVTWVAIRKDLIQTLIGILKEYPLLTSRKQCQLKFAILCLRQGFWTVLFLFYTSNSIYKNTKPSKNGFTVRFFSTCAPFNISESINTTTLIAPLNPWFVTGFSDGESTFGVSIYKKSASKLGWDVLVYFQHVYHEHFW